MRQALSLTAIGCLLTGLAGCARFAPPEKTHQAVERHALLVLYQKGQGGCVARTVERFNAYVGDKVVWQIVNECDGEARLVEIKFTGTNSPVTWDQASSITVNAGAEKALSGVVKQGAVGSHNYVPMINGIPGPDPRLDVDPY